MLVYVHVDCCRADAGRAVRHEQASQVQSNSRLLCVMKSPPLHRVSRDRAPIIPRGPVHRLTHHMFSNLHTKEYSQCSVKRQHSVSMANGMLDRQNDSKALIQLCYTPVAVLSLADGPGEHDTRRHKARTVIWCTYPPVHLRAHVVPDNVQQVKTGQQGVLHANVFVGWHVVIVAAISRVASGQDRAARIELGLHASLGDGDRLLLHHLQAVSAVTSTSSVPECAQIYEATYLLMRSSCADCCLLHQCKDKPQSIEATSCVHVFDSSALGGLCMSM